VIDVNIINRTKKLDTTVKDLVNEVKDHTKKIEELEITNNSLNQVVTSIAFNETKVGE
jgi:hypothetical protein